MRTIFVAYRENDLFRQYVPQLLEGLPVIGKFVIPEGTTLEDQKDAFIAAIDKALADGVTLFLTDSTCDVYRYMEMTKRDRIRGKLAYEISISIDDAFSREVGRWLDGNSVAQNIVWFAEQMQGGRKIEQVYVVADRINDHRFQGEKAYEMSRPTEQWIRNQIVGKYPDANVQVVDKLEAAMPHADEENTMLVLDRHCGIKEVMKRPDGGYGYSSLTNWRHKAMLYTLPFETTAAQLMDRDNFAFSYDVPSMRNSILERLSK